VSFAPIWVIFQNPVTNVDQFFSMSNRRFKEINSWAVLNLGKVEEAAVPYQRCTQDFWKEVSTGVYSLKGSARSETSA